MSIFFYFFIFAYRERKREKGRSVLLSTKTQGRIKTNQPTIQDQTPLPFFLAFLFLFSFFFFFFFSNPRFIFLLSLKTNGSHRFSRPCKMFSTLFILAPRYGVLAPSLSLFISLYHGCFSTLHVNADDIHAKVTN